MDERRTAGRPDRRGQTVPGRIDDGDLDVSHRLKIEIVATLIRLERGGEIDRTYGWERGEWERVPRVAGLGPGLPDPAVREAATQR